MWPFGRRDCVVEGHRWQKEMRKGYSVGARHPRCVADDVEQEREVCRDCREEQPWVTTHSSCLQGLSIDTPRYRELERTGFVRR